MAQTEPCYLGCDGWKNITSTAKVRRASEWRGGLLVLASFGQVILDGVPRAEGAAQGDWLIRGVVIRWEECEYTHPELESASTDETAATTRTDMTNEIVMLAVGLAVGGVAVWLILKGRIQAAADKAKSEAEAERAVLSATLQAREAQLQGLNTSVEKAAGEIGRLQSNLTSESARRAAAEERNARIPILEAEAKAKEQELAALNMDVTRLREAQAELTTLLQKERQAADEKLALLNDARRTFCDALKALSSDALMSNNQTFLDLAKTALETFQQSARTDLTARLLAIDDLITPLKESVERVDGKIAAFEKELTSASPRSHAALSARNIVGQYSGVPSQFQARCAEASSGKITYTDLGYYLASALPGKVPDGLEQEDWLHAISRLSELLAAGEEGNAWVWFHEHLPKFMELIPNRRKDGFLAGVMKAHGDGKLDKRNPR